MPAPEKRLSFARLRGMAGAGLDRQRRSLDRTGRRGAQRRADHEQVGDDSADSRTAMEWPEVELLSPNL
jgi:hypothetical protein